MYAQSAKEACLEAFEEIHANYRAAIRELRQLLAADNLSGFLDIVFAGGTPDGFPLHGLILKLAFGNAARGPAGAAAISR